MAVEARETESDFDHYYNATCRLMGEVAGLRSVLAEREAELLELKGPCSCAGCRLHNAHRGPCDIREGEE